MLQAQADFIEASSALTDKTEAVSALNTKLAVKTEAASALNIEVEQLRRELSLKQLEVEQASASDAAAAQDHAALQQQVQLQQQRLQQVQAELQKQRRCGVTLIGGRAQNQLGSPTTTQPGQVSYFPSLPSTCCCDDTFRCLSVCACMHKIALTVIHYECSAESACYNAIQSYDSCNDPLSELLLGQELGQLGIFQLHT